MNWTQGELYPMGGYAVLLYTRWSRRYGYTWE